eukprot:5799837-Karenia_brevis.AAC.1
MRKAWEEPGSSQASHARTMQALARRCGIGSDAHMHRLLAWHKRTSRKRNAGTEEAAEEGE